jgi:hypothetical protein
MAIQAKADQGDEAALATLTAVKRLFAQADCHGSGAVETGVSGHVTGCPAPPHLAAGPVLSRQSA